MKKAIFAPLSLLMLACIGSCSHSDNAPKLTKSGLNPEKFDAVYRGDTTALYTLTNADGMEVCITNFGGRIVSIAVPDREGNVRDVVLGFDSIGAYFPETNQSDFGAAVGRYANRINQGQFVLDADTFQLPRNNFGHSLHGGTNMGTLGWQYRTYKADQPNDSTLILTLVDADGNNGYPGEVTAVVTYTLSSDNALGINYTATTDKPTIINMTNHSYFNLSGDPDNTITDEVLWIDADNYTPVDSTYMTLGTIDPVEGTPFDFRTAKTIGTDIAADNQQLRNGNGYDHNWVLNNQGDLSAPKARLSDPATGIVMEMFTNEPGVQVYSGNFLNGKTIGKNDKVYNQRTGICLETQHYPDSPNKPQWPSVVLRPGETYNSTCIYKFSVE